MFPQVQVRSFVYAHRDAKTPRAAKTVSLITASSVFGAELAPPSTVAAQVDWKDTESIDPVTQTDQENEQRVIEGEAGETGDRCWFSFERRVVFG